MAFNRGLMDWEPDSGEEGVLPSNSPYRPDVRKPGLFTPKSLTEYQQQIPIEHPLDSRVMNSWQHSLDPLQAYQQETAELALGELTQAPDNLFRTLYPWNLHNYDYALSPWEAGDMIYHVDENVQTQYVPRTRPSNVLTAFLQSMANAMDKAVPGSS